MGEGGCGGLRFGIRCSGAWAYHVCDLESVSHAGAVAEQPLMLPVGFVIEADLLWDCK